MTRQNLREREAAVALSELSGRLTIREIRDFAKERGLIVVPDDLLEHYELEQTRKLIQRVRKYEDPEGNGPVEFVNLFETDEQGDRVSYYKPLRELTPAEGVQLCTYWHNKGRYADRELLRYAKVLTKAHGRRFQRLLPFELPRPALAAV